MISIKTIDNIEYTVSRNVINMSNVVYDLIKDFPEEEPVSIPIPGVDSKTFEKIISYCNYHWNNKAKPIEKPLPGDINKFICEFDQEYINVPVEELNKLINAVHMLDIPDLFGLCCAAIAYKITGKSSDEMADILGLEKMSHGDREVCRKEFSWFYN